jgi:hypothetical protein
MRLFNSLFLLKKVFFFFKMNHTLQPNIQLQRTYHLRGGPPPAFLLDRNDSRNPIRRQHNSTNHVHKTHPQRTYHLRGGGQNLAGPKRPVLGLPQKLHDAGFEPWEQTLSKLARSLGEVEKETQRVAHQIVVLCCFVSVKQV